MDAIPEFTRDFLVSIHPRHASKILNGEKTVELRRRFPEAGTRGALAAIYSTSPVQAVVGLARIRHVLKLPVARIWRDYGDAACVSKTEFYGYFSGVRDGYVIVLDDVRPVKRPVKADDLLTLFGIVPPQSYRYVTPDCAALLSDERFQAPDRHERRNRTRGRSAGSGVSR
jgi:predicted transcriptional regulator